MNTLFADDLNEIKIPPKKGRKAFKYILESDQLWALKAASATGRPLLVTGEPGVGKTQLALAAAEYLGWDYLYEPISSRTEAENLLWWYDAVARLAEAQVINNTVLNNDSALNDDPVTVRALLKESNFVKPGIVWRAYNPYTAGIQLGTYLKKEPDSQSGNTGNTGNTGSVLLLDEIDKADSDVPNSLLDVLDLMEFDCPYVEEKITLQEKRDKPLVIITSNQERDLPAAFVRRCVVLKMAIDEANIDAWLTVRAEAHFDPRENQVINTQVIEAAIESFKLDRDGAKGRSINPGLAEFLDLLTALNELCKNPQQALETLEKIRPYTIGKSDKVG